MNVPILFAVLLGCFIGWHLNNFVGFLIDIAHPTTVRAEYDILPQYDGEADRPLSVEWNLPHRSPALRITDRAPHGLSAKQILGYTDIGGQHHPPQFPGTLDDWKVITDGTRP